MNVSTNPASVGYSKTPLLSFPNSRATVRWSLHSRKTINPLFAPCHHHAKEEPGSPQIGFFALPLGSRERKEKTGNERATERWGAECRGTDVGWELRRASQEHPLQRQKRVHPSEKLTLDTIALASSTVFFKTCFIFSFGAIREKKDRQLSNTWPLSKPQVFWNSPA